MCSLVLMTAMTASVDAPQCGRVYGCGGCYGYTHGCHANYAYQGCYGYNLGCCGHTYYRHYGRYGGTVIYSAPIAANETGGNVILAATTAPAQLRITLPEDARLYVDSHPTTSQSGVRELVTPALERGRDYKYVLSATITRNHKEVKVQKEVTVRAGELTDVSFAFPLEVAQK